MVSSLQQEVHPLYSVSPDSESLSTAAVVLTSLLMLLLMHVRCLLKAGEAGPGVWCRAADRRRNLSVRERHSAPSLAASLPFPLLCSSSRVGHPCCCC